MTLDKELAKKVLAEIDRDELAQLGCDLTSIPSPTGQEKAIGEFILNWYEANGIKAVRQDVEFDRPNAVGIVKGNGTGLSLGFNGHTDTSFTGTAADARMVAKMEPESDLKGKIVVHLAAAPKHLPGPLAAHAQSTAQRWTNYRAAGVEEGDDCLGGPPRGQVGIGAAVEGRRCLPGGHRPSVAPASR